MGVMDIFRKGSEYTQLKKQGRIPQGYSAAQYIANGLPSANNPTSELSQLEAQKRLFETERQRLIQQQQQAQSQLQAQFAQQMAVQAGRYDAEKRNQQNFISKLTSQNKDLSNQFNALRDERSTLSQQLEQQSQQFTQERNKLLSSFSTQSEAQKQALIKQMEKRQQDTVNALQERFKQKEQGFLSQLESQRNTLTSAFDDKLGQANQQFKLQLGKQREELTNAFGIQRESLEREIGQLTDLSKTQEQRISILSQAQNRAQQKINDNVRRSQSNIVDDQETGNRRRRLLTLLARQRGTARTKGQGTLVR